MAVLWLPKQPSRVKPDAIWNPKITHGYALLHLKISRQRVHQIWHIIILENYSDIMTKRELPDVHGHRNRS